MSDPITAPIKDSNGNKRLDSEELLAQLRAEKFQNAIKEQPVHHVLRFIDIKGLVSVHNANAIGMSANQYNGLLRAEAHALENQLKDQIAVAKKVLLKNPDAEVQSEVLARSLALAQPQAGVSPEMAAEDTKQFFAFSKTFDKTFPQGIHIEPTDLPFILAQFGGTFIPVPKKAPAKSGATTNQI